MTETTNFNLKKPEMSDTVDTAISVYNANLDTIDDELSNASTNSSAIENLKSAVNILSNTDFANRYYNDTEQPNTPFTTENFEYIAPVEATTGVYSEAFLLPNGKYRIIVTSSSRPSNMEMVIYNPLFGCYYYDVDKDSVDFDWIKQDDKYICDFEIKTDYEQNYVMLGDVSKNMDRWNNLNV